jgi:hypothetical protein
MKLKTLAATAFAATCITFISCDWLFGKHAKTTVSLIGKWQIDSIYYANDSVKNKASLLFAITSNNKDHLPLIEFAGDSVLQTNKNDSTEQSKYYITADSLYIKSDSLYSASKYKLQDTLLTLISTDSAVMLLHKQ